MLIEFLCNGCSRRLRSNESVEATIISCPECGAARPLPLRSASNADEDDSAAAAESRLVAEDVDFDILHGKAILAGPATALIWLSALNIPYSIFILVVAAIAAVKALDDGNFDVESLGLQVFGLCVGLWSTLASVFVLVGAIAMRRTRKYGLALIVSIVPLTFGCSFFMFPFGIWSLIALCHPHVRRAFRATHDSRFVYA